MDALANTDKPPCRLPLCRRCPNVKALPGRKPWHSKPGGWAVEMKSNDAAKRPGGGHYPYGALPENAGRGGP
jgi:hypothetical protein